MATDLGNVVNLMFSCLGPKANPQIIEGHISAKVDDDDDIEILKIKMLGGNTATALVKGITDVASFINQKHKIGGKLAEVSIADPPVPDSVNDSDEDDESDLDSSNPRLDIIPDLIEVTCEGPSVDEEILEMYFGGKKSGGKREKDIESIEEIENGIYHIKYESEEDAAVVVAQAKHAYSKTKLTVRYVPAPIPKEYDKDKLIVRDVPEGVDEEYFNTIIEGKLGLDSDDDFNVDFRVTCAIIMFTAEYTDEELDQMIVKLTKRKVKGKFICIERCEVNCSIVVSNITKKTFASEDGLEMYFEQTRSGGGEDLVESVVMLGNDKAKVTFVNAAVVSQVLKSTYHKKKLGAEVTLSVCTPLDSFEETGKNLSDSENSSSEDDSKSTKKQPLRQKDSQLQDKAIKNTKESIKIKNKNTSTKSKGKENVVVSEDEDDYDIADDYSNTILHAPVVFPLDSMIAKYLSHNPAQIEELSRDAKVSIAVDEQLGSITLSQNELSPQNWPSVVTEQLKYTLSDLFCKVEIHVPNEAAGEVYPIIMGNCTREGLQYAFGQGDNKVCVAGKAQLVNKLKSDVEELCGRMIRKVEVIKVSEEDYAYLKGLKFSSIQNEHRGIQFKCVDLDHSLSANGSLHDVAMFKENLSKFISHSRAPVNLHPLAFEFLRVGKGSGILQNILQGTKCISYFVQESPSSQRFNLFLLCAQEDAYQAEAVAMKVSDSLKLQTLDLPKHFISSVANGHKYTNFKDGLLKKVPHLSIFQDNKLVIISSNEACSSVQEAYSTFISEECSAVLSVRYKKGVWRLLQTTSAEKKWIKLIEELKKLGVSIVSSSKSSAQKPFIKIKGMPESIAIAKEKLMDLQKSIVELQLPIARPGVCHYFFKDPNGQMILRGVETDANVCIEMVVEESDHKTLDTSGSAAPDFVRVCFGNTNEMKSVNVYVGDITEFNKAEVIVNAANENLKHAGGVAQAIEAKGGIQIKQDSEDLIRKRGRVPMGSAVLFPRVGNLPPPYKAIVHTVGPKWIQKSDREKALLRKAITSSLSEAKDYNSIAIPAISGGIYGFPPDVCAQVLMDAVKKFSETERYATLSEINFVVFQDNVETFISAAKNVFDNIHCHNDTVTTPTVSVGNGSGNVIQNRRRKRVGSSTPTPVSSTPTQVHSVTPTPAAATNINPPQVTTSKTQFSSSVTRKIKITNGDILKNLEDMIVNTTDQNFSFNGFVATALKQKAGPGLEEECEATQTPIQIGEVITTGAHAINAQYIVHVVLPQYDGANSLQIMQSIIVKCLDECNRLGLKSISIPSVGAGKLQYPANEVAKCLVETSAEYISKNQQKSLQLVHFVIFDKPIYQEFKKKFTTLTESVSQRSSSIPSTIQQQNYQQQPSFDGGESCNFSLPNNLRLEVVQDDITSCNLDVIVNTTNSQLRLVGSAVAEALVRKAGPGLQVSCDKLVRQGFKVTAGNVVETPCANMGSLRCKSIFHIVFSRDKLEQTIYACLERAEKLKYSSIAFPAIGTGGGSISPQSAANAVVNALQKFTTKKNPKFLNVIRMVLFQQQHYLQFVDAFKKMESSSGGYLRRMMNAVGSYFSGYSDDHEEPIDEIQNVHDNNELNDDWDDVGDTDIFANLSKETEVILSIYGETKQCVGRAEKRLRTLIDTQFVTDEINDENVSHLTDATVAKLKTLANTCNVDIDVDRELDLHFITLHGCQSDVMKVKDKVRDVLASFGQDQVMKEAAEAMAKHIQWIRVFDDGDTEEYDEVFTFEIERAFQKKEKKFISSDDSEKFEIAFSSMKEKDLATGAVIAVKRVDLMQEEKPVNWDPMPSNSSGKEAHVHMVTLPLTSEEYLEAEKKFNVSMAKGKNYSNIHSIQRLQNPILYGQYIARKKEMDRRNPTGHENENWVFHGTHFSVLENINTQGFNRIFKGKNGTVYGEGVYFARDASYSNSYAAPDNNGFKFMYLTQVLTGEYTVGKQGMLVPPPKDPSVSQHILFDSTVNNQGSPSIFVVYYDSQNYPAYLIKYK